VKLMSAAGEQSATVTTSGSYLSSSDKRVHFGLGVDPVVKEIDTPMAEWNTADVARDSIRPASPSRRTGSLK